MLAHVTNRAAGARVFDTAGGAAAMVDPGESLLLDIEEHPAHRAWEKAGDVTIEPVPDKEARVMRKRLDARVEAAERMQAEALAALPTLLPREREKVAPRSEAG